MPPLIGLTTYGLDESGRYTLPSEYVSAVRRAGGIPVLIPPGENNVAEVIDRMDAVILAGGGDIDPSAYGGQPHEMVYMVDRTRDQLEIHLARRLVQRDKPTLAICRGAQILNVALGGTLHTHLPDVFGDQVRTPFAAAQTNTARRRGRARFATCGYPGPDFVDTHVLAPPGYPATGPRTSHCLARPRRCG